MRWLRTPWTASSCGLALAFLVGCGGNSTNPTPYVPNATHGQYLVQHVTGCGDCHTPTDPNTGQPIVGKTLAGGVPFVLPFGTVYTRNLTPDDSTGIGSWSETQVVDAIRTGIAPAHGGRPATEGQLFPVMPYWLYGHMTTEDARDIVAYLKSLPRVHNLVPEDNIPDVMRVTWPTQGGIPTATLNNATTARGEYLVTIAGCIDCHTLPKAEVTGNPADPGVATNLFLAGGRAFDLGPLGTVHSKNITPDVATGIGSWTPVQIDSAFTQGYDEHRRPLCPPMPWRVFQGMTNDDQLAVIAYLRGIPAIDHAVSEDTLDCPH